jgi:FkbM family methyltransferase
MDFCGQFTEAMLNDCFGYQPRNIDYLRFACDAEEQARDEIRDQEFQRLAQIGLVRRHFDLATATRELSRVYADLDDYQAVFTLLADEASRNNLIEVLKLRALGPRHARVSLNNPDYWRVREDIAGLRLDGASITAGKFELQPFELNAPPDVLSLHAHPLGILNTFVLEQYRYRNGKFDLGVAAGDVVIDAGACWGDTTLYFANRVGADGRVYAFECLEENLGIYTANMRRNAGLQGRISLERRALWSASGEALNFVANGPGSRISGEGAAQVRTVALDDFAAEAGIERVDFIKMDIEGAEQQALRGAEYILERDRPKLAISVYHQPEDVTAIPRYIDALDLGYRCYLDHYTIHNEETILFAIADRTATKSPATATPGFIGC